MTLKLAVLGSTKGTDMQAIIDVIEKGELDAKIVAVISSRENAFILERAKKHNLENFYVNSKEFASREDYDKAIIKILEEKETELVLLIGYDKILSDHFCQAYRYKIMNIHPSLLPAFAGMFDKNVHQEILNFGAKVSGCTLHFVTEDVDAGPIIAQKAVTVDENETVDSLKDKVQAAEQEVFLKAIKQFAQNKLKVEDKRVKILD
jgi:formyltetrahydrofolate-dependent phosphoribosylglycinamide formyltransferase